MTFQTSYSTDTAAGFAGMLADYAQPHNRGSGAAEAVLGVALFLQKGANPRGVLPLSDVTADVDSILATGGASAATAQTISGASLDGVIGQGRIVPAQQVSLVLNSSANWSASTMTVYGEDADGNSIAEDILIPASGNATIKTTLAFGRVVKLYIPAQGGTGGTFTVGTTPDAAEYSRSDLLGVAEYQSAHMPYTTATYAGGEYAANETVPYFDRGHVFMKTEAACTKGDKVFVRIVTSGADLPGQVSNARSASFALVRGSFFRSTQATAGAIAVVQL